MRHTLKEIMEGEQRGMGICILLKTHRRTVVGTIHYSRIQKQTNTIYALCGEKNNIVHIIGSISGGVEYMDGSIEDVILFLKSEYSKYKEIAEELNNHNKKQGNIITPIRQYIPLSQSETAVSAQRMQRSWTISNGTSD